MISDKKNIGSRLKDVRTASKLNQNEFAKSLNLTQAYISMLENGTKENIDINTLITISNIYNININWLLTGEGTPYKEDISELKEKIELLENELKKITAENGKDNKDVSSLLLEISNLRSQLDFANKIILQLSNKR